MLVLLVYALTISSVGATAEFPNHYNLWEGSAALHEITVEKSCGTLISIVSPYEASFDLYAVKNSGNPGNCPSNLDVMTHYDKVSFSERGRAALDLEEGSWCVVVYAQKGTGSVYIDANSNCTTFDSTPILTPNTKPVTSL